MSLSKGPRWTKWKSTLLPTPHGSKASRVRNAFSFSKASSNGREPSSFSKPSSTAKIECLSHARAKSAYVYLLSCKSLNFRLL